MLIEASGAGQSAAVVGLAATAVACWPSRPMTRRLRGIVGPGPVPRPALPRRAVPGRAQRPVQRRPPGAWLRLLGPLLRRPVAIAGCTILGGALGVLAVGWGAGAAVAILAHTVLTRRRRRYADRRRLAATRHVADLLGALTAELRAGADVAAAADGAACEAAPQVARALRAAAATARLGGAVAPTLLRYAAIDHALAMPLGRLARAWALADRHGIALAEVLTDVRRDLEQRARFAGHLAADLSGPRATTTVLAALPVLGLVLGEAVGAEPIRVLATTPGQVLLVTGAALLCAGLWWSDWLIDRVARS